MVYLISNIAYGLLILLDLMVLILVLEWLFHFLPGAQLNGIRKILFRLTYPFLSWSDRFFSIQVGLFNTRGLLTAFLLWVLGCLAVPWLVLFSYSLRS